MLGTVLTLIRPSSFHILFIKVKYILSIYHEIESYMPAELKEWQEKERKQGLYELAEKANDLPQDYALFRNPDHINKVLYSGENNSLSISGLKTCGSCWDKLESITKQINYLYNAKHYIDEKPPEYSDYISARDNLKEKLDPIIKELHINAKSISPETLFKTYCYLSQVPTAVDTIRDLARRDEFKSIWRKDPLPTFVTQDALIQLLNCDIHKAENLFKTPAVLDRIYRGNGSKEDFKKGNEFFTSFHNKLRNFTSQDRNVFEKQRIDTAIKGMDMYLDTTLAKQEKTSRSSRNNMLSNVTKPDKKAEDIENKHISSPTMKR